MTTSIKKSIIKFTLNKSYKNTANNMNLNYLITPCKPPACSNITTHHKNKNHHHDI